LFDPADGIIGNGNDVEILQSLSNAAGLYQFDQVVPGSYYVQFEAAEKFSLAPSDQGEEALDSDANRDPTRDADGAVGRTSRFTVAASAQYFGPDAGFIGPDRFEPNDSLATAAFLGIMQAVHLREM